MEQLLKYGWSDGILKHILEVPNGLQCKCTCTNCGHPLVAKNNPSNKKAAHFAHHSGKECEGAYESALHLLAKILFWKSRLLRVPDFHTDYNPYNPKSLFRKGDRIKFDHVEIEKSIDTKIGTIRPDAIGIKNGKPVFVEFAKTHFIDYEKTAKIKNSGFPCIEIDLSEIPMDESAILEIFKSDTIEKYWIINPKLEKDHEEANKKKIEEEKEKAAQLQRRLNNFRTDSSVQVLPVFGENVKCPKLLVALSELKSTNFYRHPVLKRIIDGEYWNGETYGYPPNSSFIYLRKEKIIVYPSHKDQENVSPDTIRDSKLFWAGLKNIKPIITEEDFGACQGCEFNIERIINGERTYQICSHPKVK